MSPYLFLLEGYHIPGLASILTSDESKELDELLGVPGSDAKVLHLDILWGTGEPMVNSLDGSPDPMQG